MESPMTLAEMEGLVVDPTTSAEQLRLIAYFAPDLRAQVIRHPKVYPGLLDWLEDIGDPEIVALVGERRRADSGEPLRPAAVSVDAEATAIIPIFPKTRTWPWTGGPSSRPSLLRGPSRTTLPRRAAFPMRGLLIRGQATRLRILNSLIRGPLP